MRSDAAEVAQTIREIAGIARRRWDRLGRADRRRVCDALIGVVLVLEGKAPADELAARRAKR